MYCQVGECDAVVILAEVVPCLCLRHKVCEAEQEVSQDEGCHFVERLDVVVVLGGERLVPLQVDA